jgi:hypothetical protein
VCVVAVEALALDDGDACAVTFRLLVDRAEPVAATTLCAPGAGFPLAPALTAPLFISTKSGSMLNRLAVRIADRMVRYRLWFLFFVVVMSIPSVGSCPRTSCEKKLSVC